ncbi:hypothetical protein RN001_002074 [Aquatica leii]|uniref:Uncharacterized protein n=1 Tax=Aquatica leii TaxID=1421715 RepID=A0AAN7PGU9_9COLE|nr:hypothetical protein RN001_002074 [Aquatica leii]
MWGYQNNIFDVMFDLCGDDGIRYIAVEYTLEKLPLITHFLRVPIKTERVCFSTEVQEGYARYSFKSHNSLFWNTLKLLCLPEATWACTYALELSVITEKLADFHKENRFLTRINAKITVASNELTW